MGEDSVHGVGAARRAWRTRRAWRALAAVAALLGLAALALLQTTAARAAVIASAITSISTSSSHTAQGDQVDFDCTWAVPDDSRPGDTFTLQLPPELRWF